MAQYIVRTPSKEYNGKAVGVRFNNGEAFVNEFTIDKKLKKDLAQVIAELGELGYEIKEVYGDAATVANESKLADDPNTSAFPAEEKPYGLDAIAAKLDAADETPKVAQARGGKKAKE